MHYAVPHWVHFQFLNFYTCKKSRFNHLWIEMCIDVIVLLQLKLESTILSLHSFNRCLSLSFIENKVTLYFLCVYNNVSINFIPQFPILFITIFCTPHGSGGCKSWKDNFFTEQITYNTRGRQLKHYLVPVYKLSLPWS